MQFLEWEDYFQSNKDHFDQIAWHKTPELLPDEKTKITQSIQQFQKGENSEGKNLYGFARLMKDDSYTNAIKLFVKEEQTHAAVLRRFMQLEGIPLIRSHWIDDIFRKVRKLATLENSVLILITAEIIAAVYYQALSTATASPTLKVLCIQILQDEENHIRFQSRALNVFFRKRSRLGKRYIRLFHRLLMTVTIVLVWMHHKNVLSSKFTFSSFAKCVNQEYARSAAMITGLASTKVKKHQPTNRAANIPLHNEPQEVK